MRQHTGALPHRAGRLSFHAAPVGWGKVILTTMSKTRIEDYARNVYVEELKPGDKKDWQAVQYSYLARITVALEQIAETHKMEVRRLKTEIAQLKGRVSKLEKNEPTA